MTRERAKKLLPIIEAFANGKTIQFKNWGDTEWVDIEVQVAWEDGTDYRIKPEPKRFRLYLDGNDIITMIEGIDNPEILYHISNIKPVRTIELVEVINE